MHPACERSRGKSGNGTCGVPDGTKPTYVSRVSIRPDVCNLLVVVSSSLPRPIQRENSFGYSFRTRISTQRALQASRNRNKHPMTNNDYDITWSGGLTTFQPHKVRPEQVLPAGKTASSIAVNPIRTTPDASLPHYLTILWPEGQWDCISLRPTIATTSVIIAVRVALIIRCVVTFNHCTA